MFSKGGYKNIFEVRRKEEKILTRAFPTRTTRVIRRKRLSRPTVPLIHEAVLEDIQSSDGKVYVIGGGPSLKDFDFSVLVDKHTIAVNKSIFHIPNPNYFISVDYTFLRKVDRKTFNSIPVKKFFVADFSHSFLREVNKQITDTRYNMIYNLRDYDLLIRAYKQEGIGYSFKEFRTGRNSGFCALQLAVVLGFKKIYLLGLDLNKQEITHYHGGYGESPNSFNSKLDEYYDYFRIGLEQLQRERSDIQVISCSPSSRLNNILQYKSIKEVLL